MQVQTIFQAGNSDVVALPREFGFKRGEKVVVEKVPEADVVTIRKVLAKKAQPSAADAEFRRWLRVVLEEDAEILDELASR